jgi:hypothetical protein
MTNQANNINLPAGTSGQIVTGEGATSAPGFTNANAVGGYILLSTKTASSSASINFTSVMTSAYNAYRVYIAGLIPATTSTQLYLNTSNNNSSWNTGAGAYNYIYFATSATPTGSGSATNMIMTPAVSNATYYNYFVVDLVVPSQTQMYAWWRGMGNAITNIQGGGTDLSGAAVNAVQFIMSSGNITAGTFTMYGFTS